MPLYADGFNADERATSDYGYGQTGAPRPRQQYAPQGYAPPRPQAPRQPGYDPRRMRQPGPPRRPAQPQQPMAPAPAPTFREMQQSGQARPAPPPAVNMAPPAPAGGGGSPYGMAPGAAAGTRGWFTPQGDGSALSAEDAELFRKSQSGELAKEYERQYGQGWYDEYQKVIPRLEQLNQQHLSQRSGADRLTQLQGAAMGDGRTFEGYNSFDMNAMRAMSPEQYQQFLGGFKDPKLADYMNFVMGGNYRPGGAGGEGPMAPNIRPGGGIDPVQMVGGGGQYPGEAPIEYEGPGGWGGMPEGQPPVDWSQLGGDLNLGQMTEATDGWGASPNGYDADGNPYRGGGQYADPTGNPAMYYADGTPRPTGSPGGGGGGGGFSGDLGGWMGQQMNGGGNYDGGLGVDEVLRGMLKNPSAFDNDAVKQLYASLGQDIDDEYSQAATQTNEEMARRGIYDSTIAGGRLHDLNIGKRSAKAKLASDLASERARDFARAREAAVGMGLSRRGQGYNEQMGMWDRLNQYGQQAFQNDMTQAQFNRLLQLDSDQMMLALLGLGG